jgi:hypothetical protein
MDNHFPLLAARNHQNRVRLKVELLLTPDIYPALYCANLAQKQHYAFKTVQLTVLLQYYLQYCLQQ